jgi:hypothetical protein
MATAKRKIKPPKGYDSFFEHDAHIKYLRGCTYHPDKIQYVQVKMYEPDFLYIDSRGFRTYIETKGRFRDSAEARKYKDIRDGLEKNEELVFLFQNPATPFPHAKRRRDGTKLTHGGWAEMNDFRYFTLDTIPKEWKIKR